MSTHVAQDKLNVQECKVRNKDIFDGIFEGSVIVCLFRKNVVEESRIRDENFEYAVFLVRYF